MTTIPPPRARLRPGLVTTLDVIRVAAAALVVFQHVGPHHFPFLGPLNRLGQEAVMVFFLLSGFVICANERDRVKDVRGYYLRRLRRIYRPLLIVMALSVLIPWSNGTLVRDLPWAEFWGNSLALQDVSSLKPGVIVSPFMGNDPLWSLSYKIFFYLIFPVVFRIWRRVGATASWGIAAACFLSYGYHAIVPNHFSLVSAYFLIWRTGAEIAEAYLEGGRSWRCCLPLITCLIAIDLLALGIVVWKGYTGLGLYPFLMARVGAVATLLSSLSYGIYVFLYPRMVRWDYAQSGLGVLAGAALTISLAWFGDRWLSLVLPRPRPREAKT